MTWLPPLSIVLRGADRKRRLALCLDIIASACLIAGTAALLAIADTRTFGVSRAYVIAVVVTAPILGLLYIVARKMSAERQASLGADPTRTPPRSMPYTGGELRRRLAAWVVDLIVWVCVLNVVLLPGNLVLVLNRWLDRSKPVDTAYVVDNKKWLHKDKRAYFQMPRAGAAARESVPVSTALYDRIAVDHTKVVLTMHDGALGFRWTKPADLRWADLAPPR